MQTWRMAKHRKVCIVAPTEALLPPLGSRPTSAGRDQCSQLPRVLSLRSLVPSLPGGAAEPCRLR
jgi:hypothetical protein